MLNRVLRIVVLLVIAGAASAQAPESLTVRVGLLGIADNIPVLIADKHGYFKDEGLSINVTTFAGGAAALPALIAGKIDIVHSNLVSVMLARAEGYDVMLVSNNSVASAAPPDAARVIVKKDSPLQSPKDLEGKRVAVNTLNNVVWVSVRSLVEKRGGDARKVNFIEVPFPQMLDALMNDRVDAIANIEPFSTIADGTGKTRVIGYFYTDLQPGIEIAGMVAMENWVKKNPVTTRRFVNAFGRGIETMTRTRADVSKALVEYTKMNPTLADKVSMNTLKTKSDPKSVQLWEDMMLKSGLLKKPVGIKAMIYETALK